MVDVFSRAKRSEIMSRVKGRSNLATELALIRLFREHRIVGWRRHVRLFGRPDFIFSSKRVAVFVDGCFWHGCPRHGTIPLSNRKFWEEKLSRNRKRDKLVNRTLRRLGWTPVRVWQHELREPDRLVRRLCKALTP
jgi:DNA mismatch endonuclease (patch repair protein)